MVPILADIKKVDVRRGKRGQTIITAQLEDDSGTINAMWFNQAYITATLRNTKRAVFIGEPKPHYQTRKPVLMAPKIEAKLSILPIYSLTASLTSRFLNHLIKSVLEQLVIKDDLSASERKKHDLISLKKAYHQVHLPQSMDQVKAGQRRLVFDELFNIQKELAKIRQDRQGKQSLPIADDVALLKEFVAGLEFKLTDDQKKAIWQMTKEMASTKEPMHRLLNGDVGSGKTVVAAALALLTVKSGHRAVVLAPTEILALQHEKTFSNLLQSFNVSVGLVTAKTKDWQADVLVGTHALISNQAKLDNIGLVVIDEQHRFGVEQREKIVNMSAQNEIWPHLLSLTATPIPRSLALVLFGDLDISVLKEKPQNRQHIETQVIVPSQEDVAYQAIAYAASKNEQSYVVCPLIERVVNESLVEDERQSVTAVYKRLHERIFPDLKIAVLHGKHQSEKKGEILSKFRDGKIDILVATSVVEVGVDIPNATVMLIESAERFGVAGLHQLRGRVGRSDKKAQCFLMVRESSSQALSRCQKVASTNDGFILAQFDLGSRGPGDLVGIAQKGINKLFLDNLDFDLIKSAQELAHNHIIES